MAKKTITGYRFLDKDPVVDTYRRAKEISGLTEVQIAAGSGVTPETLRRWDKGGTKRPQHLTMRYAMHAMGFEEYYENKEGKKLKTTYTNGKA